MRLLGVLPQRDRLRDDRGCNRFCGEAGVLRSIDAQIRNLAARSTPRVLPEDWQGGRLCNDNRAYDREGAGAAGSIAAMASCRPHADSGCATAGLGLDEGTDRASAS